jgi:hypothetical protein
VSASVSPHPSRFAFFAARIAKWADDHAAIVFSLLTAWYVALLWNYTLRPLWYDELSTYYIARQSTVASMAEAITHIDLNPPLNYFLARWLLAIIHHPWAARMPALVAYWAGSLAIFHLLRRRTSSLIAAIGVLLFWSNPYFLYASEARPYGLLLGLTAILVVAWAEADDDNSSRIICIATVFSSALLLLLSHIFGVLSLGAVWIGEAVRIRRRRRVDWLMIVALLLPLVATITYRPMLHTAGTVTYPPESQATWGKLYFLYYAVSRWMWRPLLALAIIAFALRNRARTESRVSPELATTLALLFLIPVGVIILLMRSHGAYFDRYGMAMVLPIVVLAPLFLSRQTSTNPRASVLGVSLVALLLLISTALRAPLLHAAETVLPAHAADKTIGIIATSTHGPFRPWWKPLSISPDLLAERNSAPLIPSLASFDPTLPIAPANELTYIEMDNREPDSVAHRLYYIWDQHSELTIAHRSAAISMLAVRHYFPLRSTMEPYSQFIQRHREFLVVGTWEHSGDWLLRKLQADGAQLTIVGHIQGYEDSDVYHVIFPAQ